MRKINLLEKKLLNEFSTDKLILDIGTSKRFAKELSFLKNDFDTPNYIAAGYEPDFSIDSPCDEHQNIECLTYDDSLFDLVICLEVLEHVSNPFAAIQELYRVLKPNGTIILTTPFFNGYHGKSNSNMTDVSHSHNSYPDYWRFTEEGIRFILKDFNHIEVIPSDSKINVIINLILGRFYKFLGHSPFMKNNKKCAIASRFLAYGKK